MITDIQPNYIAGMVVLFAVTIQCRCSHTAFDLSRLCIWIKWSFHFIVSRASLGRFLLPCSPTSSLNKRWSPRWWISQGQWFAWCGGALTLCCQGETPDGLGLPCHCRPTTVPLCEALVIAFLPSKSACNTATISLLPETNLSYRSRERKRERVDLLVSKPHFVLELWKSYSSKADTLYSNT